MALAEGARQLGFDFVARSSNGMTLNLQGRIAQYQVRALGACGWMALLHSVQLSL